MKNLFIAMIFFLISTSILSAKSIPISKQTERLNQRLELISKVELLTNKLSSLKSDHLRKMNEYAELIERKELEFEKFKKDSLKKIEALNLQNRKDREAFNIELKNQRVLLDDNQAKYSENIQNINSEYLNEITEVKMKYDNIIKESANDYQRKLSRQHTQYVESFAKIKDCLGTKIKHLNAELTELKSTNKILLLESQKRLSNLEKNVHGAKKTLLTDKSDLHKNCASTQLKKNKQHSFFYRLCNI